MKDRIFHIFGNIIEQSPIPTRIKVAIAYRLDVFLYFISTWRFGVLRNSAESRISEDFIQYMYKNNIDSQKIEILTGGFDDSGKALVRRIIQRQRYMFTHNIFDIRLLTKNELKDQHIDTYHIKKKYWGISNYYGVENFYFHCGLRFVPKNILKKYENRDLIDAGASNGDTAAIFSREYAFRTIHAFEPENHNFALLIKNINKFALHNVIAVHKGLGDKKRRTRITSEEGQSHISADGNQTVDMITIDEYVWKNRISVGLIKMDIEGFEYYALAGSLKTIKKYHPILLISIYHTGRDFFEIKPLLERLGGYTFMVKKLNPYHYFFDTVLICLPVE